jgi:hypothetical protein
MRGEPTGPARDAERPQVPQVLLDGPGTSSLERASLENAVLNPTFCVDVLLGGDPQVLRFLGSVIDLGEQRPILAATEDVHGFGLVLHDVEAIEGDLGGGQWNGFVIGVLAGQHAGNGYLQEVPRQLMATMRVVPAAAHGMLDLNVNFGGLDIKPPFGHLPRRGQDENLLVELRVEHIPCLRGRYAFSPTERPSEISDKPK